MTRTASARDATGAARLPPRTLLLHALAYAALTVALTWPVAARLGTHVPLYNDTWIFVWDMHHVRQALLDPARAVFETRDVFWPDGISLAFHTLAPLAGALAIPLEPVLGLVRTYDLLWLLTFVASACAMEMLAFAVVRSAGGAFLAGALYAFSAYHQAHAPHLNLLSLEFLPLSTLALLRLLATGERRPALWLAVTAALSFYACLEYALFTALLAAVLLATALLARRSGVLPLAPLPRVLGRALLAGAVTLALTAPGLVPLVAEASIERHYFEAVDTDFSADVFSWITPSVLHSIWGGYTMKVYQHFPGVLAEWTTYVGVVVAALSLVALGSRSRREALPWVVMALVFGVLALGPALRVLGNPLSIPLPYRLLKALPLLSAMREPSRFAAVVTLATSLLAAIGFRELSTSRVGRLAWAALPLALLEVTQVPYPTSSAHVPAFLERLAAEPAGYAVLEVPSDLGNREHLYHQAVHGKPIFLGYIARIPDANRTFVETLPFLRDPQTWPRTRRAGESAPLEGMARLLRVNGVRYALVYAPLYARRQDPQGFDRSLATLLAVPGARLEAAEEGFAAVRFADADGTGAALAPRLGALDGAFHGSFPGAFSGSSPGSSAEHSTGASR